jgi:hypothetical protein
MMKTVHARHDDVHQDGVRHLLLRDLDSALGIVRQQNLHVVLHQITFDDMGLSRGVVDYEYFHSAFLLFRLAFDMPFLVIETVPLITRPYPRAA